MSNHTPEPWRVGRPGTVVSDTPVPGMGGSDAVEYYGGHLIGESITEANARRIVACVNACQGLSTDELEQHGLVSAVGYELIELTKQRDELLSAAKFVVSRWDTPNWKDAEPTSAVIGKLRNAIANAEENHFPDAAKMVSDGCAVLMTLDEAIDHANEKSIGSSQCAAQHAQLSKWLTDYRAMLSAAPKFEGGAA